MSLLRRNFPGSALGSHHNRSVDTNFEKYLIFFLILFFRVTINERGIWAQPLYKLLPKIYQVKDIMVLCSNSISGKKVEVEGPTNHDFDRNLTQ